ncbi:GNAT family N-acetyltransferase [Streptomyces sp. NPDC052492]|uniref:GNAT family N-acetyltransferase n=1 Tax=Streptomyces sp. NPDC052492 TaxID=3365691 RepID=UPI0037D6890E
MAWSVTGSPGLFRREAGAFVSARPDRHTMLLSALDSLERAPLAGAGTAARLGWWREASDAPVTAAFVGTPHLTVATALPPDAVRGLARSLLAHAHPYAGLMSDEASVRAFEAAWEKETGAAPAAGPRLRLHRLDRLVPPVGAPPGAARVATEDDRPLLRAWCDRFVAEAGSLGADLDRFVDERIAGGGWRIWSVDDEPVATAARTTVVAATARITPVYVPPPHRGRGYGAAVTAAVSRAARDAGAEHVLLFTDLSNPVSNRLYARIGYRPVADYRIVTP